jgi:hypothetical protein
LINQGAGVNRIRGVVIRLWFLSSGTLLKMEKQPYRHVSDNKAALFQVV